MLFLGAGFPPPASIFGAFMFWKKKEVKQVVTTQKEPKYIYKQLKIVIDLAEKNALENAIDEGYNFYFGAPAAGIFPSEGRIIMYKDTKEEIKE
jgi:hypothetical protein